MYLQNLEFRAMNTGILLVAEGPVETVETGFNQARKFIEDSEKRMTRFSSQSELSQLNRSSGGWFDASNDLFEVVMLALQLHQQTAGAFDPSILAALEQAGYDRSMDEVRRAIAPNQASANPALVHRGLSTLVETQPKRSRFSDVRLDESRHRIALPEGMRIDLGGIAKSWIAEKAAHLLADYSDACAVDAGGDIFFIGLPQGETAWKVTLEDPLDPTRGLAMLKVPPGAVATSTVTKRRWMQGGKENHHLIDPRTQQPAVTEWLSVTVVAAHATDAEVLAKSLLIGGPAEVDRSVNLGYDIQFIAVDRLKQLLGSKNSQEILDA
jgi:FAD:protein FMN transferase